MKLFTTIKINYAKLASVAIAYGIFLRLFQYLYNRSLWLDEVLIATNLAEKSLSGLLGHLDYLQCAPVGFLLVQKAIIFLFGYNELALRLFPFACSIASLFLFKELAKSHFDGLFLLISTLLFALSDPLIYYSSEAKQYSSDVMFTLIILLSTYNFAKSEKNYKNTFKYTLIGIVSLFFSHPSIIILFSCGLTLFLKEFFKGKGRKLVQVTLAISLWEVSFLYLFYFHYKHTLTNSEFMHYWNPTFSSSLTLIDSLKGLTFGFIDFLSVNLISIGYVLFFIGLFAFLCKRDDRTSIYFLSYFTIFIISYVGLYPMLNRLLLFIAPISIMFITEGLALLTRGIEQSNNKPTTSRILIALLLFQPLFFSTKHLIMPRKNEEVKQVLEYITKDLSPDTTIYVNNTSQYAFKYYASRYDLITDYNLEPNFFDNEIAASRYLFSKNGSPVIIGKKHGSVFDIYNEIDKLRGQGKVWFIFTRTWTDEKENYLTYLETLSEEVDSISIRGKLLSKDHNPEETSAHLFIL